MRFLLLVVRPAAALHKLCMCFSILAEFSDSCSYM